MLILVAVSVKILIDSNIIGNAQSAAEQTKTAYEQEGQMGKITVDGKEYASAQDYVDNNEWKDPALNPSGTIPEGGTYYVGVTTQYRGYNTGATATLTAGQAFPTTISLGDKFIYGDYEYRYGIRTYKGYYVDYPDAGGGWAVYASSLNKAEYGPILESINGLNVTCMANCFYTCLTCECPIVTAPNIPDSVTNLECAFARCTSLKGDITINSNPTYCSGCFSECAQDAEHAITITGSASAETKAALKATGFNSGANISY